MPQPSDLRPIEIVGIAVAAGIGWGIVMALVAWVREGAEIVLLQAFYLAPAWFFGRAAGGARMGALAGFALVCAAVYTFELLPMWGLETALRREALAEGVSAEEADLVAARFDRSDIALFSTLAVGALIGLAAGRHGRAEAAPAPAEAAPAPAPLPPEPPRAAPEPLWAGYGRPQPAPAAPDSLLAPPPDPWLAPSPEPPRDPRLAPPPSPEPPRDPRLAPPPSPEPPRARRRTPWGAAFLLAAFATDVWLDRRFDMYSDAQAGVAIALLLAGALATIWFARRYALAMIVAGLVLAAGFASVQHAEYEARAEPAATVR